MIINKPGDRHSQAIGDSKPKQSLGLFLRSTYRLRSGLVSRGFTLIETFVAIVILTTALAGALALAANGFNSADIAGDQITAAFLAQDAMEYVRFKRDSSTLQGIGWLDKLTPMCVSSAGSPAAICEFDTADNTPNIPRSCSGTCDPMSYDTVRGFYNYAVPNSTDIVSSKFTRTVSIVTQPSPTLSGASAEATVIVRVVWRGRNGATGSCSGVIKNCVILREEIYNLQ